MNSRTLRLILFIAVPLIILSVSSSWIFEWMWMNELGYSQVFWTLKSTQILLTIGAFIISAGYLVYNFRYLAGQLTYANFSGTPFQNINIDLSGSFGQKRLRQFFTLAGLAMAFIFAISFFIRWDESLRFFWEMPFGETDPIFGRDIGYYLFQFPFWELLQSSLISIVFLTSAILVIIYLFSGLLTVKSPTDFSARQTVMDHLSLNVGIWLLFLAWGFFLARYRLLFKADGIVFGAGYTDIMIQLPAIWVLFGLTLILGVLILINRWVKLGKIVPAAAVLTLVVFILGRVLLPGIIQQFNVEPNELELERPYLSNNIEMTRLAYNLHNVTNIEYEADDTLGIDDIRNNQDAVDNIRLWDPRLLIGTYKQLQEIRSYYEFYSVDNDRYNVDGKVVQMMLSAREIARTLPSQSDTWVNRHLQYTHGYGLVMSPVTETNEQGEPLLTVRNLPPVSDSPDLNVLNAAIYYGENSTGYYIVNSGIEELHYPDGDENVYTSYSGQGGIQISNFFKKLLFAWELGDINILLTDYITPESRLQIWRSVQERIRRISPFLQLDSDPYLVMNNGNLVWIQDAYTTSSYFPYSQKYGNNLNYIRNSVKIVVDAYEGTVDYYVIDEEDPVLQVYQSIFPDLFKPVSELPDGIADHFRYPQDLFEIQLETFNRYHMTQPQVFYNQEDLWTRPNEKYGGQQLLMEPYYVLARLPGEDLLEFMLISPLTPENRDNMISWMAAKSDPESYGDLIVYKLPKERLIYGPAQIEARIDQDPEISQQIALWDQRGSRVIRGNLMVIPIENSFLYVEPVFLLAEGVDIPQLQRVIVAIGDDIAMQPTIEQAMFELFGDEADFLRPGVLPVDPELAQDVTPEQIVAAEGIQARQLEEIRTIWQDLVAALEEGNWTRYGELLNELDEQINNQ
ncbi:MAG: UPF0182 family protein [Balneolaceae bacterium]